MKTFDYLRADDLGESLARLDGATRPYAGGTDLLTRMKLGITTPERLLDIKSLDLPRGIERDGDTLRLGALTTLAEIERHRFPPALALLAEAASRAATPQLRERATIGGNLLQRPRCWYYRDPEIDCWLGGGEGCPAREGRNEQHAIFGEGPCVAVHPSDLASCLLALDARVTLEGPDGQRSLALGDFFAEPEDGRRHESVIADDELVRAIEVPLDGAGEDGKGESSSGGDGAGASASRAGGSKADGSNDAESRGSGSGSADTSGGSAAASTGGKRESVYLKAMDRKVWAFALVGVAAVARRGANGDAPRLRLVASGVASVPWRLDGVERALDGASPDDEAAVDAAIEKGLADAKPLSRNAYKVALLRRLVKRAVAELR